MEVSSWEAHGVLALMLGYIIKALHSNGIRWEIRIYKNGKSKMEHSGFSDEDKIE